MKDKYLLPKDGEFFKANLHSHTVLSDGSLTPIQAKQLYKDAGYSIIAFTDHRHYAWHKELNDDGFLALAAFEADMNEFFKGDNFGNVKTFHINFYDTCPENHIGFNAIQPPQRYGDIHSLNQFIMQMNEDGFISCYNHPYWSLQNYTDYKDLRGVFAMEIYNHGCELDGLYGANPQSYDELLREGVHLNCLATDDNHNSYKQDSPMSDSLGGWCMIKTDKLCYENIISALKNGEFYSSTGPQIHELYIKDNALHVRCSAAEKIYVVTSLRRCYMKVGALGENSITEAVFDLKGDEGYIRVDIRDNKGAHAYSNAHFINN